MAKKIKFYKDYQNDSDSFLEYHTTTKVLLLERDGKLQNKEVYAGNVMVGDKVCFVDLVKTEMVIDHIEKVIV